MSLDLIVGPMFSGKSSYLLATIRKFKAINMPMFIITSVHDTRYKEGSIVNHNQESFPADVSVASLLGLRTNPKFLEASVVIIEEAQFYNDLVPFVLECVDIFEKTVFVAGLDGDVHRRPFGKILELVPYCDSIIKTKAFCKSCNDGTEAIFSSRKEASALIVDVGGADKYESLCRTHYLAYN